MFGRCRLEAEEKSLPCCDKTSNPPDFAPGGIRSSKETQKNHHPPGYCITTRGRTLPTVANCSHPLPAASSKSSTVKRGNVQNKVHKKVSVLVYDNLRFLCCWPGSAKQALWGPRGHFKGGPVGPNSRGGAKDSPYVFGIKKGGPQHVKEERFDGGA